MATFPADIADQRPHVPARAVLLSAAALWFTYFLLITLRGVVTYQGEFAELLWRRALVTLAGIAVTLLAWPVLRRFDGRSNGVRIAAALVIMLPAAVALAAINQQAFAPVERKMIEREANAVQAQAEAAVKAIRAQQAGNSGPVPPMPPMPATPSVRGRPDVSGNMLIDVADPALPQMPPAPPEPPASAAPPEPADPAAKELPPQLASVVIHKMTEDQGLWKQLTDVALGRYFLLIAWAGLYLALGNAEMARASERREGEYKRAAKAAELRSLRYQVNPHFLFNTLNSLSALVMVGRTEQAEKMIQTISSFYRHSLAGDPTADVRLADEIALQRHYLEIEAVRFPERLVCEFDVPESLESACVPGMILQPLVENPIKYGVSASTRPVTIRIAAQEAGGRLVLTVADDGPGKTSENGGTGIGLENVRSRLAARFGDEARVDSAPPPAGGYATVLTIPLVRAGCEQGGMMRTLPMKTLIVDDEPLAVERMQILCARIPALNVVGTASDGAAALRLSEALSPELVLLDMAMPEVDGLGVARGLAKLSPNTSKRPAVIFVTAHDHFAVEAFDLEAVDYVLKPVAQDRLERAVERALERFGARQETATPAPAESPWIEEFWVPHRSEPIRIAAGDIDRIDAERDYVRLHVGARNYLLLHTIQRLEDRLDPERFIRLHRSTIVRRDRIAGLKHDGLGVWSAQLADGELLRIGRTYLAKAKAMAGR